MKLLGKRILIGILTAAMIIPQMNFPLGAVYAAEEALPEEIVSAEADFSEEAVSEEEASLEETISAEEAPSSEEVTLTEEEASEEVSIEETHSEETNSEEESSSKDDETETTEIETGGTETGSEIESETIDEQLSETEDVMEIEMEAEDDIDTAQYLTTVDAAGEKLRQLLTGREAELTVYYQTAEEPDDGIAKEIWNAALKHTGKPTEGDYIRFQCESPEIPDYDITEALSATDTTHYLTITYKAACYTTYGQETELAREIEKVINSFEFQEETSDYQRIKTIYDYICQNCGSENSDDDDALKHTAYAALTKKTAAGEGYASLLYRLLLECGIDTRIISGTANGENHAWNIVKCGESYYYLDAAWDIGNTSYSCFLKGSDNFSGHTAGTAYISEEFTAAYPVSRADAADDADNGSGDDEEQGELAESGDNMKSEEGTEAEDNTGSEAGTEAATDTEDGSGSTDKDEQKHDERPSIKADGVLFPGKKADGYSAVYTGERICPTMTVKYTYQDSNGKSKTQTLKLNVDYTVTYKNNINVGGEAATVTIKGIGEYQGTVTKEFIIAQKSISKVTLSATGDIQYGETPRVTVMDGTKELAEGRDYTVSWTEGSPDTTTTSTLTVKAVESKECNYTGTANKKITFKILGSDAQNAVSIKDVSIEWKNPNKSYTYNGKAQKPAVVVKDKNGKKVSSSYYKVIYTDNVNAGTNTAKAYVVGVTKKGAGYYGTSEPLTFTINQKNFVKVSASIKGTLPKFGTISDIQNVINEAVVVKDGKTVLSYGADYTIDYGDINSFDNIKIGTKYTIAILPANNGGNYTLDKKTLKIKFGQLNLASKTATVSLTVTSVDEKKVILTYNGKRLEQGTDYTVVSIKKDKNTDLYTVKIKAVSGSAYKGSLTFKGAQLISLTLDKARITGMTGETVKLTATVNPADMQHSAIKWQSSNESVATVTDEGLVSLTGSGTAIITASASTELLELTAQCQVAVKGELKNYVSVTDFGAVPDDGEDDREAFARALDALGKGNYEGCDTVYVPEGTYHIDPEYGIVMPSNTKLYMHQNAVLKAIKCGNHENQVVAVYSSDVEISGGTIIGELIDSKQSGESGMGIRIQLAQNVYIHDVTIKECRGDGIYIGGNVTGSTNISIIDCTIADNSRNNIGIVSAHDVYIDGCTITGAGRRYGTAPRACILIEKNSGDKICTDIVIKNSTIDNKEVCSKQSEAYAFGTAWINWPDEPKVQGDRLTVENCKFKGKVANYSVTNAKFIKCTFDGETIFKKGTIVEN